MRQSFYWLVYLERALIQAKAIPRPEHPFSLKSAAASRQALMNRAGQISPNT